MIHLPAGKATCSLYFVDIAKGWRGAQLAEWVRRLAEGERTALDQLDRLDQTERRAWLVAQVRRLVDEYPDAARDLAELWPVGVPTLKQSNAHTAERARADRTSGAEGRSGPPSPIRRPGPAPSKNKKQKEKQANDNRTGTQFKGELHQVDRTSARGRDRSGAERSGKAPTRNSYPEIVLNTERDKILSALARQPLAPAGRRPARDRRHAPGRVPRRGEQGQAGTLPDEGVRGHGHARRALRLQPPGSVGPGLSPVGVLGDHDPIDVVTEALARVGCELRGTSTRCPAHDDEHPSLSVTDGQRHGPYPLSSAPATTEDVVDALGLTMSDLFPVTVARDDDPSPPTLRVHSAHAGGPHGREALLSTAPGSGRSMGQRWRPPRTGCPIGAARCGKPWP